MYRRALAHVALHDEDAAEQDLRAALGFVPGDAAIRAELDRVRELKKAQREKEKKAFKKMFA